MKPRVREGRGVGGGMLVFSPAATRTVYANLEGNTSAQRNSLEIGDKVSQKHIPRYFMTGTKNMIVMLSS